MEFTIKSGSPEKQRSACVVVGVFDNRKLSLSAELIDRAVERLCQRNHPPRRHGGQARRDASAAQRPRHARRPRASGRPRQGARLPRPGIPLRGQIRGQAAERDRLVRGGDLPDRGKGQAARGRLARRARGRRGDGGGLPLRPDEKRKGRSAPAAAQAHAVGSAALGPDRRRGRGGARPRDRARHGLRARPRQPARQRLHADLPGRAGAASSPRSFPTSR